MDIPYRFNGKKGQFHVQAKADQAQAIADRLQHGEVGYLLRAVLVAPSLGHDGQHIQHRARPTAAAGRDWVWADGWQDEVEADPDVGDVLLDGVDLPPLPPEQIAAVDLPLYEYMVCLEFKAPYSNRPGNWALRLLNPDPQTPLIAACTPLIASTEEDAVELMLSEHCCEWGAFTLGRSTLPTLLNHCYHSLLNEPEVKETIAKHVPLKRVADVQHRRDILDKWKKNFPYNPALYTSLSARAAYKKGWKQWMDTHITAQPQPMDAVPDPLAHMTRRQLVLLGPPALDMAGWVRSHGPHVYMCGRLDLPLLQRCLADGGARYLVLHNIPWSQLLAEDKHGHSILTNASFNWYHGNRLEAMAQRLPVIVLNDHLPNPDDPRWAPRGWLHWKSILHVVKLLPHVPLFEQPPLSDKGKVDTPPLTTACDTMGAFKYLAQYDKCEQKYNDEVEAASTPTVARRRTRSQSRAEAEAEFMAAMTSEVYCEAAASVVAANEVSEECKEAVLAPLRLDLSRRIPYGPDSFYYPDAIPEAHRTRLLHVVAAIDYVQMKYRGRDLARQKNFQSDNIAGSYAFYEYTGSVPDVWHLGEWSPEMLQLRDALRAQINELINSLVANQYLDGTASIDHHSDKTPDIQRGTSIWTVSLGATRLFELRKLDGRRRSRYR